MKNRRNITLPENVIFEICKANNTSIGPLQTRIDLSIKEIRKIVNKNGDCYARMLATKQVKCLGDVAERRLRKRKIMYI